MAEHIGAERLGVLVDVGYVVIRLFTLRGWQDWAVFAARAGQEIRRWASWKEAPSRALLGHDM